MAVIDSLISYWALDEASGDALDSHGTHPLTETSGIIDATTGKVGGCRDFELDDTEYFLHADHADLSTGDIDFTLAGWVRFETVTTNMDFVSKWESSGNQQEYLLRRTNGNRINFIVSASGSNSATVADGTPISADTWYFVVAWHDSVGNTISISVNNNTQTDTAHTTGVFNGTGSLMFGANIPSAPTLHLDGMLDEWGFSKKVLSSDERTWLYNTGTGRTYAEIQAGIPGVGGGGRPNSVFLTGVSSAMGI